MTVLDLVELEPDLELGNVTTQGLLMVEHHVLGIRKSSNFATLSRVVCCGTSELNSAAIFLKVYRILLLLLNRSRKCYS